MSNELTLLLAVGSDTPGNVSIVPAETPLTATPAIAQMNHTSDMDFRVLSRTLDRHSIPGVQDKISATMPTTPVSVQGIACLIKLDPEEYPHLTVNEELRLRQVSRTNRTRHPLSELGGPKSRTSR